MHDPYVATAVIALVLETESFLLGAMICCEPEYERPRSAVLGGGMLEIEADPSRRDVRLLGEEDADIVIEP